MKGTFKTLTAIALIALLTFGSGLSAFAATVTPTTYSENQDPDIQGYSMIKFDRPRNATKSSGGNTIEATFSEDDKWVSFDASQPVEYVYVKGGNQKGYLYHYPSGTTSDSGLRAPDNTNNNVNIQSRGGGHQNPQPEISHVTFYFKIKGSITINKIVYGNPSTPEDFTFKIVGPSGTQTVVINGAGSTTVSGLLLGFYTITEISIPDDYDVDDDIQYVLIHLGDKHDSVTFKNTYTQPTTEATTETTEVTTETTEASTETTEVTTETTEVTTETTEVTTETTEVTTETTEVTTETTEASTETTEASTETTEVTTEVTTETTEVTTETTEASTETTEASTETTTAPATQATTEDEDDEDDVVFFATTEPVTEPSTEAITEEEIPLGPQIINFDSIVPEVITEEEIVEEEVVLDEEVPLADALPQTGQLPMALYYGVGSVISLMGFAIRKKK